MRRMRCRLGCQGKKSYARVAGQRKVNTTSSRATLTPAARPAPPLLLSLLHHLQLCGCCDAANGGPGGFICKYFCGMCACGKMMSFTGADGEGPQAVAAPGNCFMCTLFGATLCGCCNYGAFAFRRACAR